MPRYFDKEKRNSIWMDLYHKPTDTQKCLTFTSSHPDHCEQNIPYCFARRICTITENNAEKLKNLENLKSNLSKYNYLDLLLKQGFEKALSIPQKGLKNPKKSSNENILLFITTFNPSNSNIYTTCKSSITCLKNNSVSGFHNIKVIQSKRQAPNLKKFLTKAEYGEVLSGKFNCSDERCDCCNYLLIINHYTF